MSEKTKEVPQLADTTYAHTLVMNQGMSIGCVGKLGHLFGFLRHYLLTLMLLSISLENLLRLILRSLSQRAKLHLIELQPLEPSETIGSATQKDTQT